MPKEKPRRWTKPTEARVLDAHEAKAAFEETQKERDALSAAELEAVRVDPQLAAAFVHAIATRDAQPARHERFERLAKADLFHLVDLDTLAKHALATWYARQQQVSHAKSSGALVTEAKLREAMDVRARMLKVLEHAYDEDPSYGPRLVAIRAGSGYLDLANDLSSLADLYELADVHAVVSKDARHYLDTDVASARDAAQVIFRALGLGSDGDGASWADHVRRAYTLTARGYSELQAAGAFLFRHEEDVAMTYPTLVGAVRVPPRRGDAEDGPAEPVAPSEPAKS